MNSAIRRSQYRGGAGGRQKAALARLHSRARYSLALLTAEGGGSFAAPTGHALSSAASSVIKYLPLLVEKQNRPENRERQPDFRLRKLIPVATDNRSYVGKLTEKGLAL